LLWRLCTYKTFTRYDIRGKCRYCFIHAY